MRALIPQAPRKLPLWLSVTVWLAAFVTPTGYFLLLLILDRLQVPAPPDYLVVSLFCLIPILALLVCGTVVWLGIMMPSSVMSRSACESPLRLHDSRKTAAGAGSVGYSGENTISAMLAAKDRQLNTGPKKRRKPFEQFIAERLHQLELIDQFQVRQISQHRKEYEVKVKTPGSPSWVDLPDVGFGVSQILPVLVECFYAPPGSILFIEQPELHLHPKAQSHLADLFIDVLSSRVDGRPRNIQLVIETHSEHFLQRLQRRIAEGLPDQPITPGRVAAYFAHTAGAESNLEPLQIDSLGNITNWPQDFFGDLMGEAVAMSNAQAQRHPQTATLNEQTPG